MSRRLALFFVFLFIGMTLIYYSSTVKSTPQVISVIVKSSTVTYRIINMDDRTPSYHIATLDGQKPDLNGDNAQATVVEHLRLVENCKRDPSLVVVDVGAFIGDFGLYAAACGCQVYMFEVQSNMIDMIETSILVNNFSSSRVHLINKAVNDLPSNSSLRFSVNAGDTTAKNGTLHVSTIRLDDVNWPSNSTILLLKIDVEGFELPVLRSAEKLFRAKRVHHLIFEYTAYWTDRAAQQELLPFVENTLGAKTFYALHRLNDDVYGPLTREDLNDFHQRHVEKHLQTDIYATFDHSIVGSISKAQPYTSKSYA